MAITTILPQSATTATAASGDRTLYLYYTHTKETGRFTFRKNGQYDKKVLSELNYFLRDWRRNEPATMDPALFDLVWEVYQEVGATQPINIVSAYRSPKTNEMLRSQPGSGVAENSQHTKGHAMDFFIPGINLTTLRATAMKRQVGGVGYYPTSGSPFVHLDTGNVRAWPRMTRAQLQKVFPDGRTLHLPAEGKPLSEDGRQYAMAQWQQCHTVPCNSGATTRFASNDSGNSSGPKSSLFGKLFGGGDKNNSNADVPQARVQMASTGPADREVKTINVPAPVPMAHRAADASDDNMQVASLEQPANVPANIPFSTRGSAPLDEAAFNAASDAPSAPVPARKSAALMQATGKAVGSNGQETAVLAIAALDTPAPIPASRSQAPKPVEADMLTAYAPAQDPESQRALQMIIERETTASVPKTRPTPQPSPLPGLVPAARTASITGGAGMTTLKGIFDQTFGAVNATSASQQSMAKALAAKAAASAITGQGFATREGQLTAPDLEHVADIFGQPVPVSSGQFGVLFPHDEGDFNPATEMGSHTGSVSFASKPGFEQNSDRFVKGPILVTVN